MSSCVERCWVATVWWHEAQSTVRSLLVVVLAVDAEHMLEMPSSEDHDSVEAVRANRPNPALGVGAFAFGAWMGVRITLIPSVRNT